MRIKFKIKSILGRIMDEIDFFILKKLFEKIIKKIDYHENIKE